MRPLTSLMALSLGAGIGGSLVQGYTKGCLTGFGSRCTTFGDVGARRMDAASEDGENPVFGRPCCTDSIGPALFLELGHLGDR